MKAFAAGVFILSSSIASADEPVASTTQPERHIPAEPEPAPQPPQPTAKDVEGAPRPGNESGRLDQVDAGDSTSRAIGRGVLFVPKIIAEIAFAPVRGVLYAENRYDIQERYYRWFYNDDRTIGIVPTATYTTGLGGGIGAHFFDTNTFGEQEHINLAAVTGLAYQNHLLASIDTGNRLGPVRLEVGGNFDRRPSDPFYGIGNNNVTNVAVTPIDPLTNPTAVETFNRYQEERVAAQAEFVVVPALHLLLTGSLTKLSYQNSTDGPPIDQVYNPDDLIGFVDGVKHSYGELEVRWDTRRSSNMWEPADLSSTGVLVRGFGGQVHLFDGQGDYWRYGAEFQQYVRLGPGPHVLSFRLYGEGVTGDLNEVPFSELPALGGASYLRGYVFERFRDRVAMFGSVQYEWDLTHNAAAYLFVDAGRVYDSLDSLTADGMRVGYGIGLEFQGDDGSFLMEGSIASSIDGGIVLSASFNPILNERRRWR